MENDHVDIHVQALGIEKNDAWADAVAKVDGVPPESDAHEYGDPLADSEMVEVRIW